MSKNQKEMNHCVLCSCLFDANLDIIKQTKLHVMVGYIVRYIAELIRIYESNPIFCQEMANTASMERL